MATKEKTEEKKVEVKVREGRDTGLGNKRDGMRGGGERKLPKCVSVTRFVTVQTSITSAGTQVSSRDLGGRQRHPWPSQHLLFTESLHKLLLAVFRDMNFLPIPRFRGGKSEWNIG